MRIVSEGDRVVLSVRDERDVGERAQRAIDDLPQELFVRPKIESSGGELRLVHQLPRERTSFADVARRWQENPIAAPPLAIGLARHLVRAAQRRAQIEQPFLPLAPSLLFRFGKDWRTIAIPSLSPPAVSDWADLEDVWPTAPPEAIVGDLRRPDPFGIGALLHLALIGELIPRGLARSDRFGRQLAGRVGRFGTLEKALRRALPASLEKEARALLDLVTSLMDPDPTKRPTLVESAQRIGELETSLSAHRIAVRWEHAGRIPNAREVLERHGEHAPKNAVAWGALSRLRQATGDTEGALEASIKALETEPQEALGPFLRLLSTLDENLLMRGLVALRLFAVSWPDEGLRLKLAHLERGIAPSEALGRLAQPMSDGWNEVLRLMVMSRIWFEQNELALISKNTKTARQIIEKLPDGGGRVGRYAKSYLALLDGAANFAAVGRYARVDFLASAYEQLIAACESALDAEAPDLFDAAAQWLWWIKTSLGDRPPPELEVVRLGIAAYLETRAHGSVPPASIPKVPWYADGLIFPG